MVREAVPRLRNRHRERRAGEGKPLPSCNCKRSRRAGAGKNPTTATGSRWKSTKRDVIIVPCPRCGVENMIQIRLKAEVTRLVHGPEGESMTAVPDAVIRLSVDCSGCQQRVPRPHQAA